MTLLKLMRGCARGNRQIRPEKPTIPQLVSLSATDKADRDASPELI